jgi:predicted naringenin-chalcone synthase
MTDTFINKIATALPPHDVHRAFGAFAQGLLKDDSRKAILFGRMAEKSGIGHRFSYVAPLADVSGADLNGEAFYRLGAFPSTARRMQAYEKVAPLLATDVVEKLLAHEDRASITHLITTSCTGFYAPGIDMDLVERCGLNPDIERSTVGFMGCYAAINALKLARHIVRSEPTARVLALNLELCTLHLQQSQDLNEILSFLLFGDGAAAALISADPVGAEMQSFHAALVPNTRELIRWNIRDQGFDMVLSGGVPAAILSGLAEAQGAILGNRKVQDIDLWAVHPGGRTVLDAVQHAFALPPSALAASRGVLYDHGNMSSGTVMFVLDRLMRQSANSAAGGQGCAMAFGPGLVAETMRFQLAA